MFFFLQKHVFTIYKTITFFFTKTKRLGFLKRNFKECFQKLWKLRNKGIFQKTRNSQTGEF